MAYHVLIKCGGGAFFVPNEAAENLRLCSAVQLRILLLALSRGQNDITPEIAAKELCINVEDAKDALDYWCARNILQSDSGDVPAIIVPEKAAPAEQSEAVSQASSPDPEASEKEPEEAIPMKDVAALVEKDKGVSFVLREAQRLYGKTLTTYDSETLSWLKAGAGAEPELIVTVIEYCRSINKCSTRYIKNIVLDWLDIGIDTVEKAEERIHILNENRAWEGEIKRVLEIYGRNLISKEKEFCESWKMLKFTPELIRCAYERAIEQTGKCSFAYINGILMSWKQKGITTPEEAAKESNPKAEAAKPSFDISEVNKQIENELFF